MFDALIIGAGKIASQFDSPENANILTHAHAYTKHHGFNLLGFYDVNHEKSQLAAKKWSCSSFVDLSLVGNVDVVSICTPDDSHVKSLRQAAELKPRLIFLEKPITNDISAIPYILDISKNIPIAVNYSRRYVPEFQLLSNRISAGEFGCFIPFSVIKYT